MSLWTSRSEEFQHEALFYATQDELIHEVADFVADGLVRGEPAVVALSETKLGPLRELLGGEQPGVRFLDMDVVGKNPAHLIPAYREVIDELADGRRSRGVGEPVGPGRQGDALVECQIHESLCNVAYPDWRWWVVCPYDTSTLAPDVLDEARRSHPLVVANGIRRESPDYREVPPDGGPVGCALGAPPPGSVRLEHPGTPFDEPERHLKDELRATITGEAGAAVPFDRVDALADAAASLVAEGASHGLGAAAAVWRCDGAVVVEVRMPYQETDPLAGRSPQVAGSRRAAAFNAANQTCDLFQVRTEGVWTAVRLHMQVDEP